MDLRNKIEGKLPIIVNALIGVFTGNIFIANLGLYAGRTSIPLLIASISLVAMSGWILFKNKEANIFSIKKILPLIVLGIIFGVYGLIFVVPTYILYAFIFLFQIPLFVLSIDKETLHRIFSVFAKWYILFYCIYLLGALALQPIGEGQYCGILVNPNLWGECVGTSVIIILFMLEETKKRNYIIFLYALMGITLTNVFFSRSRTTLLAVVAVLIVYAIYNLKERKQILKKFLCIALACVILLPTTFGILNYMTPNTSAFIFDKLDISMGNHSSNGEDNDKLGFGSVISSSADRYLKGLNDNDSFSSGRTDIWKIYISKIEMVGHEPDDLVVTVYDEIEYKTNAHNTFLQVAYYGGIPAFIIFAIHILMIGIFYLKKLIFENLDTIEFISIAFLAQAGIYMILSNSFGPYNAFSVIGYWFVVVPLFLINERARKVF